jgi:hypothetical protein
MQAVNRLIDKPKYEFLREQVHKVKGWLNDYAAIRTIELLDWQETRGMSGPVLEIGVFAGRYFSILLRSAVRTGSVAVGVDTFQWVPLDTVRTSLAPIEGSDAAVFLSQPSTYLSGADLLAALGAKPRFVSIDGSHESEDVMWDLRLAEDILAAEGLVSVDDFLNPMTLGVNEGVHRFFNQPRNLAPVAYTANKLFLARPFFAQSYRTVFQDLVVTDDVEGRSEEFRKRLKLGRDKVEGRMWGHPILFVP